MATSELQAEVFGRETEFAYSETTIGYAMLALRLVMGWTLFYAGVDKVLAGDWSAEGFLLHAIPEGNPFVGVWSAMANSYLWAIDPLVMWGLTLTGLGLMLGAFTRWNAFWGAVMMLFFWAASLPLEHGIVVDSHVVYALLLFGLGAFGTGRVLGVDQYLEEVELVERYPRLRYLLG